MSQNNSWIGVLFQPAGGIAFTPQQLDVVPQVEKCVADGKGDRDTLVEVTQLVDGSVRGVLEPLSQVCGRRRHLRDMQGQRRWVPEKRQFSRGFASV